MGHNINMRSSLLTIFVCASLASDVFLPEVNAASIDTNKFYRMPDRRADIFEDNAKTNELLSNILSDVDAILSNREQPRDNKASWLRDILEGARQRRNLNIAVQLLVYF